MFLALHKRGISTAFIAINEHGPLYGNELKNHQNSGAFGTETTLRYFDAAVNSAGRLITRWEKGPNYRRKAEENLRMCFEYTLGVFRMRQNADDWLRNELSMNAERVRTLYKWVECAIDDGICLKTFRNLSVSDKKQYEHVPYLLYALLVYITGREEGDTIQISGVSFDE